MRIAPSLAAVALVVVSPCAHAVVHHVDCSGGEYSTISAAVGAASDGDTVSIAACSYAEQVFVQGKSLVFQGSGADVTELTWASLGAALELTELPDAPAATVVRDLAITHPSYNGRAITIDSGMIVLEQCRVDGYIDAEPLSDYIDADVEAYNCELDDVSISDDDGRASVFEDCNIHWLWATAAYDWQYGWAGNARVELGNCNLELLNLNGGNVSVTGGEVEFVWASNNSNAPVWLTMEDTEGEWFVAEGGGDVTLVGCAFDSLWYLGEPMYGELSMSGCLVRRSGRLSLGDSELLHNTFGGRLSCWPSSNSFASSLFTSNIFRHGFAVYSDAPAVFTNNCFGVLPSMPSATFVGNIEADPLFCGQDDFSLQDCSPCVGAAHDGTDIGAFGVGCECSSPVTHVTWGSLKALYR